MTLEATGYTALRDRAAWLNLDSRGRFLARGRDRARFLHNVTSNEVKKMTPGSGGYAFVLTPQGRIQADLYLFCFEDHFLLDTEADLREKLPGLILKYKVADQIELKDVTLQISSIGLEGPQAEAVLTACGAPIPTEEFAHAVWGDVEVARISLTGQPGFRLYAPAEIRAAVLAKIEGAGAVAATAVDARVVRIENGKPRYGEDIVETSLVQETQQMHAVSFTKGCYLGQEIVERVRAQGRVNWKLEKVELEGSEPPAPGTKIEGGDVTSAVYSPRLGKVVAIARVRAT